MQGTDWSLYFLYILFPPPFPLLHFIPDDSDDAEEESEEGESDSGEEDEEDGDEEEEEEENGRSTSDLSYVTDCILAVHYLAGIWCV